MSRNSTIELVRLLGVLSLLFSGCAQALSPTPVPPPTVVTPAAKPATSPPAGPAATPKLAAEQPRYGGILTRSTQNDPPHFDLQQATIGDQYLQLGLCYEQLLQYDPLEIGKMIPDLAERWEVSPDGLTYTFQLRTDVQWHDGAPFTAEDAALSLERLKYPERYKAVSPRGGQMVVAVDKMEAVDKKTLRVQLKFAQASFIPYMSVPYTPVVPKHIIEKHGDLKKVVVGTGPFKFKQYSPGVVFEVEKNPTYRLKGKPYLDGVRIYAIADATTRFAAFRTGRVLLTGILSYGLLPDQAEVVKRDMADAATAIVYPAFTNHLLYINHATPQWKDVRVRKAADLVIDRRRIDAAYGGYSLIGGPLHPEGAWGIPKEEMMKRPGYRQAKDQDVAEAKRLMAEAGYPNGFKTTMITRRGLDAENIAVALKAELAKINIEAVVQVVDPPQIGTYLYEGRFEVLCFPCSDTLDDPDSRFAQIYITKATKVKHAFGDEKIDEWFVEQSQTADVAKRREIVLKMQERVLELVPHISLVWYSYHAAHWNVVKNWKPGLGGYYSFKMYEVWLAK